MSKLTLVFPLAAIAFILMVILLFCMQLIQKLTNRKIIVP